MFSVFFKNCLKKRHICTTSKPGVSADQPGFFINAPPKNAWKFCCSWILIYTCQSQNAYSMYFINHTCPCQYGWLSMGCKSINNDPKNTKLAMTQSSKPWPSGKPCTYVSQDWLLPLNSYPRFQTQDFLCWVDFETLSNIFVHISSLPD